MKNIVFVFVAVGLLAGCNETNPTDPILMSDTWVEYPDVGCSEPGFHVANVEDFTPQQVLEACDVPNPYYSGPQDYYVCWMLADGEKTQVVASPTNGTVSYLVGGIWKLYPGAATLCTNK